MSAPATTKEMADLYTTASVKVTDSNGSVKNLAFSNKRAVQIHRQGRRHNRKRRD
jgi:hypothetical protein